MFLKELNKEESICFLNLVSIFTKVDNKFAKEEKVLVHEYKEELGINSEEIQTMEYDDIIKKLNNSSDKSKLIIYFELVGLALVDGDYENEEVDFLEKISKDLNISRAKKIQVANCFYNFSEKDGEEKLEEMAKDIIG